MRASITLAVIALLGAMHGKGLHAEEDPASSPEADAITICEQTIAEQTTEVGELQWPGRDEYKVRGREGGDFLVEGYVDRLGPLGTVRKSLTCTAAPSGDGRWRANFQLGDESNIGAGGAAPRAPSSPPVERDVAVERSGPCRSVRFADVTADRHIARGFQVVKGRVQNFGALPIKNLRVCALDACTAVRDDDAPFVNGSVAAFTIEVPNLEPVTMSAECSVVDPG